MVTFVYECDECGKMKDHSFDTHSEKTETVECECGGTMQEHWGATFGNSEYTAAGDKIYWSDVLGVQPDQVQQTMQEDRAMGSMAQKYSPDGRLGFSSHAQKVKYAADRGFAIG